MELYFTERFEKNLDVESVSLPSETGVDSWSDEQLIKAFIQQREANSDDTLPPSGQIGDELRNRNIGVHHIQGQEAFFYSPPTGDIYVWTTEGFDNNVDIDEIILPDSDDLEDWSSEQLMKVYFLENEEGENITDADIGTELFDRNIGAHYLSGQLVFLESD
jgi:hypothetical protein